MKTFLFVVTNQDDNKILAIYTKEAVAKKMQKAIESKLNVKTNLTKQRVDEDLTTIGG